MASTCSSYLPVSPFASQRLSKGDHDPAAEQAKQFETTDQFLEAHTRKKENNPPVEHQVIGVLAEVFEEATVSPAEVASFCTSLRVLVL